MGTTVTDMEWVRMETQYVTGISRALGGSGDPSPVTGFGAFVGLKAAVKKQMGRDSISGLKVAVQGVGHVGFHLVKHLSEEGAKVFITDIVDENIKRVVNEFGSEAVGPDDIYDLDVDIYAPCALGATLNDETIPNLKCSIVAGAANNQLKVESEHGQMLKDRGILYAPDYAVNAGGLINVANEIEGYNRERAFSQAEGIYDILLTIFKLANKENIPTHKAANMVAEKRMEDYFETEKLLPAKKEFYGET